MSSSTASETKVVAAPAVITLKGKVAIVTGASRGIGQGIALSLARDGAKVVVNYNSDKKSADAVVAAINSVTPSAAIAIQADIAKSADVDRLFAETKVAFGKIDIVVANSGIAAPNTPLADTTNEHFDRVFDVNVKGTFYTLRAAANSVENNGRIIVIGSGTKTGTFAGYGAYAATKGAIEVLSNTLAQELGGKGITVNIVHPGGVLTDAMRTAGEAVIAFVSSLSPFKRIGSIEDIGDAVALLASESGRWISGQSIHVNGAAKV